MRRVVEIDGYAYHSTRSALARDRRKDIDLELAGYRVTRFTGKQVTYEAEDTLERVTRLTAAQ